MHRRTFIHQALATSALMLPGKLWSAPSKNAILQVAQIGTGRMGMGDMKNALAAGLSPSASARVVAACDVDARRVQDARKAAEAFYKERGESEVQIKVEEHYQKILDDPTIDAVIISTPDHSHALIAIAAAKAGKHIYLQKPLTYSIPEGQALVKAVREHGVVLQTGSQQRSSVYFRQVSTIIRNQWMGALKTIEVEIPTDEGKATGEPTNPPAHFNYPLWLAPVVNLPYIEAGVHPQNGYDRPGWLQRERFCLGMITGWGSHMYDIAQWALGCEATASPFVISAHGEFPDRGLYDVHTAFNGTMTYANGIKLISRNGAPHVKFTTETGWAYCSRDGFRCSDPNLLRRKPSANETSLYQSSNHMADFLESARKGSDPVCPVEAGHLTNTICVLHHTSMKLKGRSLKWDPQSQSVVGDPEASALIAAAAKHGACEKNGD